MGYDNLRKKTDGYVKDKESYDYEFEDFSQESEKLNNAKDDFLKLDSDVISAFGEVESEFDASSEILDKEREKLDTQKEELSDTIGKELETLDEADDKLSSLARKKYGEGFSKAREKSTDYISQLEKMLDDIGSASDHRTTAGGGGALSSGADNYTPSEIGVKNEDELTEESIIGYVVQSIISPHDSDVKKWTSYLDSFTVTIRQQYAAKYGQYIKPGKLDVPLSETLVYETRALFNAKGISKNTLGYNDGIKSRVVVGTGHELQTTIHENLHQLSANGYKHGVIEISGNARKNVQINEAITEMLTQRTLGEQYGGDYSAYSDNRDAMKVIESVMGEDIVCQAYFQNKPELMKNAIDSTLGPGTWEQLAEAFDDNVADTEHTRRSGAIRRDAIVNRYLIASAKQKGGEDSWREMLS